MRALRPSLNTYLYWSIITLGVLGSGRSLWLSPSLVGLGSQYTTSTRHPQVSSFQGVPGVGT